MTYFKHNAFTGEMYLSKHDTEFLGLPVGNAFSGGLNSLSTMLARPNNDSSLIAAMMAGGGGGAGANYGGG